MNIPPRIRLAFLFFIVAILTVFAQTIQVLILAVFLACIGSLLLIDQLDT